MTTPTFPFVCAPGITRTTMSTRGRSSTRSSDSTGPTTVQSSSPRRLVQSLLLLPSSTLLLLSAVSFHLHVLLRRPLSSVTTSTPLPASHHSALSSFASYLRTLFFFRLLHTCFRPSYRFSLVFPRCSSLRFNSSHFVRVHLRARLRSFCPPTIMCFVFCFPSVCMWSSIVCDCVCHLFSLDTGSGSASEPGRGQQVWPVRGERSDISLGT